MRATESGYPDCRPEYIEAYEERVSTLDLTDAGFTLLAGPDAGWAPEENTSTDPTVSSVPLTIYRIGAGALPYQDGSFTRAYGIDADGGILVRPDGHIAWRTPGVPLRPLRDILHTLTMGAEQP
ncbi:hypothetical protein [Micromonospora endophytica]|uniref:aromatic-ring hydroxylase C-terminal domain-containing protein n=1 Tax=Micromonospora endophytica TaxID=515350 RepID=UPI003083F083